MTNIVLPESEEDEREELKYKATEVDEENFFLMYHFHWSPSEVEKLNPDFRKWIIARTFAQKNMEREAMEQMRLMNEIGPNMKKGPNFTPR